MTKYYFAGTQRAAMRKYTVPKAMAVEYFLGDHLGSTSITTDNAGVKVSEMRYKPWGEVRSWWTSALSTTPAYKLPDYTFTGQFSYMDDPSTTGVTEGFGLMFYNARWYDPALGRFAQADTIVAGGVQGFDRYAYANNSPLIYTDPSGHNPQCGPDGIYCDPTASFEEVYGISFTGEMQNWTKRNVSAVKNAVVAVAAKLCSVMTSCKNAAFAFNKIYRNGIEFEWETNCYFCRNAETIAACGNNFTGNCAAGGAVTLDDDHVMISSLSGGNGNTARDNLRRRNNIVHELGHAFDSIMEQSPRDAIADDWQDLQRGADDNLSYGFASQLSVRDWQQNPANNTHEVFADMFLGWVFNKWEVAGGVLTVDGSNRQQWMNQHMPQWINP